MKAKMLLCSVLQRLLLVVLAASASVLQVNAQDLDKPFRYVFPEFVDGRFPDESFYRSTIQIANYSNLDGSCTLQLYGMTAGFAALAGATTMNFQLPANGFN